MSGSNNTLATVNAYYQAYLRVTPPSALAQSIAASINSGSQSLAGLQSQLLSQAQYTTIPALTTYNFFYANTPASTGLDFLANYATTLANQGFSLQNVYVNLGASFAANSAFANTYGPTVLSRAAFLNTVYTQIFGHAPSPDTQQFLLNSFNYYASYAGSELGAYGSIVGILLYTAEQSTPPLGSYPPAAQNFLNAAAAGTVTYQEELIANYGTPVNTTTSFTLTTGIDIATANQFFGSLTVYNIDGKGPTLNPGDNLTGIAGLTNNTLTITDLTPTATDNLPAGVILNNIQDVVLNTSGNTAASGFSTTNVAGVTSLQVITNGAGPDVVQGANGTKGTAITATHNATTGGALTVLGGATVSATENAAAQVLIGLTGAGTVPAPGNVATGAITVTTNSTGGGNVDVVGGTTVTATASGSSYTGVINIGNDGTNTGNNLGGGLANPTGNVTVNDSGVATAAGAGGVTVFGGANDTVAASGVNNSAGGTFNADNVVVGDATANVASNQPTGTITITNKAPVAYDGLNFIAGHNNATSNVSSFGGTNVSVTTNTGKVTVGTNNAVATTLPSGTVTVVDTANDGTNAAATSTNADVAIYGGTTVAATVADAGVIVGGAVSVKAIPSGTVSVTETQSSTQQDLAATGDHAIVINGGNGITVTALGQNVAVGTTFGTAGAQVVTQTGVLTGAGLGGGNGVVFDDGGSTASVTTTGGNVTVGQVVGSNNFVPTGAVTVADNFGAGNATNDAINTLGGTTVGIAVASADKGAITVGAAAALNAAGTGLKNAAVEPTGNVTIADSQTNGTTTTYGTGAVNVFTNGATTASITGGSPANVVDVQSTLATGGPGAGKAVGTSTLASVVLDGAQTGGAVNLQSDALTALSVLDNSVNGNAYNITNNTTGYALTVTLGNDNKTLNANGSTKTLNNFSVTDVNANAASITVTDNGKASTSTAQVNATKATTASVTTTAAASLDLSNDTALTKITATNKGSLNLGALTGLANLGSIDATGATSSVKASINPGVTSFNAQGSSGNDTITLSQNGLLHSDGVTFSNITGGSGSNTIVANYAAALADTALGNNAHIKNFGTLAAGALASSATTHAAYQANVTASAQVDTTTITAATIVAANVIQITVTVAGSAPVVFNYTVTGAEAGVNGLAAAIAGAILGKGITGITVGYAGGTNLFTVTGPAAGNAVSVALVNTTTAGNLTANTVVTTPGVTAVAGDAFYDATGFSALTVGQTTGDVTFKNAAAGATLAVTASQGGANILNYLLANSAGTNDTLPLTVGVDGTPIALGGTGTDAITTTVATTGIENVTIASLGDVKNTIGVTQTNLVTIGDNNGVGTGAQTITITGDQAITLTLQTDKLLGLTEATSNVQSVNASGASGAVNINGVTWKNNATHTITGGTGLLTATGGTNPTDVDNVISGTGGVNYTIGAGGSWVAVAAPANGAYQAGSETINLTAATKASTLVVNDGAVATFNSTKGGVTGFIEGVSSAADLLTYGAGTKTIIANVTSSTVVGTLATAAASASAIDATGALLTKLQNLTFTVSNGVITFSATGGNQLTDFSSGQLVSAAEIIVNNAGGSKIAAFTFGGSTYVVTDDAGATLAANGGHANTNLDSIVDLIGLGTVSGFGTTGAANTVLVTNVAQLVSTSANTGTATAQVYNDSGFSLDAVGAGAHAAVGAAATTQHTKQSYTFNNLAASATLNLDSGAGATPFIGDVVVAQTGTSGSNSLAVNLGNAGNATTVDSLSLAGDAMLVITPLAATLITSLIDSGATNTLTTVTIKAGGPTFDLGGVTDTALTTIDASKAGAGGGLTFGDSAALTQAALTLKVGGVTEGVGATTIGKGGGTSLGLSGTGDTVTIGSASDNNNNGNRLFVAGSTSTITIDGTGANTIIANGAGDTITVGDSVNGDGANTITATGGGDTLTFLGAQFGAASATVGNNATVTFGNGGGSETITITGDVTGATSSGTYAYITLNNVVSGAGEKLVFNNAFTEQTAGGTFGTSLVNVASATTLSQALDLAIAQAAISAAKSPNTANGLYAQIGANTGVLDWFQFGGNTYVTEAVNATGAAAAHPALAASDAVVKIAGLVDLTASTFAGSTLTL